MMLGIKKRNIIQEGWMVKAKTGRWEKARNLCRRPVTVSQVCRGPLGLTPDTGGEEE